MVPLQAFFGQSFHLTQEGILESCKKESSSALMKALRLKKNPSLHNQPNK